MTKTYDCQPTLTDSKVFSFCRDGYLMLEGIVPNEINQKTNKFIDQNGHRPLLKEDWFIEQIFLNSQVVGVIRSLLGANFALPIKLPNHRAKCPLPAQNWHRDGGSRYGCELNHLQVFYYPQDTPAELGPTEVLPGSHFLFSLGSWMGHYEAIRGSVLTTAPAGSIYITTYSIWHRRGVSTAKGIRNMLKYIYWRTTPPKHDWIKEPDFNHRPPSNFSIPSVQQQHRNWYDAAEMYYWLCGSKDKLETMVGDKEWPPGYPVPDWTPENYHNF